VRSIFADVVAALVGHQHGMNAIFRNAISAIAVIFAILALGGDDLHALERLSVKIEQEGPSRGSWSTPWRCRLPRSRLVRGVASPKVKHIAGR